MNIDPGATVTSPTGARKIGNKVSPSLPKTKGPDFNIRDQFNDVLMGEKHLTGTYTMAVNEAIRPDLRALFTGLRDQAVNCQWQVFGTLYNLGEYQADIAAPEQVADVVDVFSGYQTQLPYDDNGAPLPIDRG